MTQNRLCIFLFNIIPLVKDPGSRTNSKVVRRDPLLSAVNPRIREHISPCSSQYVAKSSPSIFPFPHTSFLPASLERTESPFGPSSVCVYNTCQRHSSAHGYLFCSSVDKAWHDCSDIQIHLDKGGFAPPIPSNTKCQDFALALKSALAQTDFIFPHLITRF